MDPKVYAGFAETISDELIETRRQECNEVRPDLLRLSISWQEAGSELVAVERFLGFAPNLLSNLVRLIVNDLPYENLLERITTAYVGAVENLDRAVLTLQGGVERSGKPLFSIYWSERDKDSNEEE